MVYKKYGDTVVLRLEVGDEITSSVQKVAEDLGVLSASVSGIGATDDFTVGVFDMGKRDYERFSYKGNHEINTLIGNITQKDGKPYVHLHLTATGKEGKVVGGHLLSGVISLTAEIFIHVFDARLIRERDEKLCINLIDVK